MRQQDGQLQHGVGVHWVSRHNVQREGVADSRLVAIKGCLVQLDNKIR